MIEQGLKKGRKHFYHFKIELPEDALIETVQLIDEGKIKTKEEAAKEAAEAAKKPRRRLKRQRKQQPKQHQQKPNWRACENGTSGEGRKARGESASQEVSLADTLSPEMGVVRHDVHSINSLQLLEALLSAFCAVPTMTIDK